MHKLYCSTQEYLQETMSILVLVPTHPIRSNIAIENTEVVHNILTIQTNIIYSITRR